jgi:hypothetical protein
MRYALKASLLLLLTFPPLAPPAGAAGRQRVDSKDAATVDAAALGEEVRQFLGAEVAAHLADIKSLDPPPERVLGAGSSGEYTWGTWARALAAYAEMSGERRLAGRDIARTVGEVGLLEYRLKSTRFSQLYCVLALRHFGRDLERNAVWQSLTEEERAQWRKLLDVSAFYDAKAQKVIGLPENYLGVAARIASVSFQLGLLKDRELLDGVVTRAARPFAEGNLYADDAPPTGRFDRYSNEYARFVWAAAEDAGRKDILDAVRSSLKEQMRLWWDLVQPDGYGYAWGRSLGVVSYLDTLEIVAFLARNPEFRPAPLAELASAYYQAWRWLRHDYDAKAHKLSVFAFGRGNYAYISPDREWQQTTGFFGKAALAHMLFTEGLAKENLKQFPSAITRADLARFEFFRRGERRAGVWLVRQGPLYFTLPITTGTKPGVADYLPAPHGLPGFAAPVEQVYPALVPFVELADGRVLVATDGADEIEPSADGHSLRVVWRRWALVGSKSGQVVDPGITSEVVLAHERTTLTREETLKSSADVTIKRWWVAVPTTGSRSEVLFDGERRRDRFVFDGGALEVSATADWPLSVSVQAAGGGATGRGARGGVPLHLVYESRDVTLKAGQPARWRITLKAEGEAR